MKRVLFVLGMYSPLPSANGVCVLRLQEALLDKGIESDVICEGIDNSIEYSQFGKVIHVEKDLVKSVTFFSKLHRFLSWPINSAHMIKKYLHLINQAKKETSYIAVIAVMRPIEAALACAKCGNFYLYECDSITNNGDNLYGIKHLLRHRADIIEKYVYDRADFIFHLECHRKYYSKNKYAVYSTKSEFVDIPHLKKNVSVINSNNRNDSINLMYFGSLEDIRNSPDYSIELFERIKDDSHIKVYFFSRGCEDKLDQAAKNMPDIIYPMGYVSQDVLNIAKSKVDVFLSIGFAHTGEVTSIPSKVFEYMATGKPIVHIIGGNNDTALPYLEKYGNALILDPNDGIDNNANRLKEFLKNTDRVIDIYELRELFPHNTPEWTVDLLLKQIESEKNDRN